MSDNQDQIVLNEEHSEKKKAKSQSITAFLKGIRKQTESCDFESSKYGEVEEWISTGDLGLNRIISGSVHRGIPSGRVILLGGQSQCSPRNRKVRILRKKI